MAAPKGNQFWKQRSEHGRDTIFSTPDIMWQAACKYFNWSDSHPWWKNEAVKGGELAGTIMKVATARPYTLHGLCLYLHVNTKYFNEFEKNLQEKEGQLAKDFSEVVTRIRETIYTQKFEGAAVGAFNHNIIARDLGLIEKQQNGFMDKNGNAIDPPNRALIITKEEVKQISQALENDV